MRLALIGALLVGLLAIAAACGGPSYQDSYAPIPEASSHDLDAGTSDAGASTPARSEARACKDGLRYKPGVTPATRLAGQMPKGIKAAFSRAGDGTPVWTYVFGDGSRLKVTFIIRNTEGGGQQLVVQSAKVKEHSQGGGSSSPGGGSSSQGGGSSSPSIANGDDAGLEDPGSADDGSDGPATSAARACADGLGLTPGVTTGDDILAAMPAGAVSDDATVSDDAESVDWTYTFDDGSRLIFTLTPVEYEEGGSAYLSLVDYRVED